jgi:cytochrome c oxidase subunit 4
MSEEHAAHPYYKVLAWLTFFTILEIMWSIWFHEHPSGRGLLIAGLSLMAAIKAALVGLYYMHLKYEGKVLWFVIAFPLVLVVVMVAGLLPDAFHYWPAV